MTWINIKDRFPEEEHCVLVYIKHTGYFAAFIRKGEWHVNHPDGISMLFHNRHTMHWMEFPKPPIYEEDLTEPQEFIVKRQQELKEKLIATNEEAEKVALKFLENNRELIRRLSDK